MAKKRGNAKRSTMIAAFSILSMTIGGLIYVLWRPVTLNMFSWFSAIGLSQIVDTMRIWADVYYHFLPKWIYFSAPQALWLFSGCLAIHLVWLDVRSQQEQFWMVSVFLMAFGGELGQFVGIVQGTFDLVDITLVVLAFMAVEVIAFFDSPYKQLKTIEI